MEEGLQMQVNQINLQGRKAVVTGGASGLGFAITKRLLQSGADVALWDLKQEALDAAAFDLAPEGPVRKFVVNVADHAAVKAACAGSVEEFGAIDILVNSAGIAGPAIPAVSYTPADWQSVIDVNLTGVFLCGREAAQRMVEGGRKGCIINISSISRAGNMGQTNYSAAKAGVTAMAVAWAKELARYGIRAAAVAPGFINTEMVAGMKPEAREKLVAGIPLRRMGEPDEIAHTVEFILQNDYVSGRVFEIDGALRL